MLRHNLDGLILRGFAHDGGPRPQRSCTLLRQPGLTGASRGEDAAALSIVICTHDRYDLLGAAIASVERQTLDAALFELIIVDNSSDRTAQAAFLEGLAVDCRCDYAIEDVPGVARARNIATRLARGDIVAYLDDDAVADPGWAAAVVARFEAHPSIGVLGGPVAPIWPAERPSWLPPWTDALLSILDHGPEPHRLRPDEWLIGANLAFRKAPLMAAGGFPENLGRRRSALLSNEDLAATQAVIGAGFVAFYDPRMRVRHHVHPERLNQTWLRRRMAWQVVSDAIGREGEAFDNRAKDLATLGGWLGQGAGRESDISALLDDELDQAGFSAQLQGVAALLRLLLAEPRR